MLKAGANKKDAARIANMSRDGETVKTISMALKIEEAVVRKFMKKKKKVS